MEQERAGAVGEDQGRHPATHLCQGNTEGLYRHPNLRRQPQVEQKCDLFRQQLPKLVEVRGIDVGNGAHFHSILAPIHPMIAKLRTGPHQVASLRRWPDENVDEMFSVGVHQNGDAAAVHDVQSAPLERETRARQILDRRRKIELASEPGFHRVLIGRDDILEMTGLQRAQMGVHDRGSEAGLGAPAAQPGNEPPTQKSSEDKSRGGSQPAPSGRAGRTGDRSPNGRGSLPSRANFLMKSQGRAFVKTSTLERGAQGFQGFQSAYAFRTGEQMTLEIRGARGVELPVEIPVEDRLRELTTHGWPPGSSWDRLRSARVVVDAVRERAWTSPCRWART